MIIISDTSVISNLILIQRLDLLPALYGEIRIPQVVEAEILQLESFNVDISEFKNAGWVTIQNPTNKALEQQLLTTLDPGESAAIALAHELSPTYLAIDEKAGRLVAETLGINIIGLIGILIQAKEKGILTSVKPLLDELITTAGFFISKRFYQQILAEIAESEDEK